METGATIVAVVMTILGVLAVIFAAAKLRREVRAGAVTTGPAILLVGYVVVGTTAVAGTAWLAAIAYPFL